MCYVCIDGTNVGLFHLFFFFFKQKTAYEMLVVSGSEPGDGLGQLSDGVQEILGADVVANRAVGHRGVEQRGEGGAESLQEVTGQPREGRVPRVQRRSESAFGREQVGEPVDPLGECFGRLVRGTQGRARVGDGVDPAFHDGLDQVSTLREVTVQRADSYAGQVGDLLRRRVYAGGGEDGPRGLDQRADVALRVGAARALRRVRLHYITSAC